MVNKLPELGSALPGMVNALATVVKNVAALVSVAGDAGQLLCRRWSTGWRFAATIDGESVGTAGAPSVLVAYGDGAKDLLVRLVGEGKLKGRVILLNDGQASVYRLGIKKVHAE